MHRIVGDRADLADAFDGDPQGLVDQWSQPLADTLSVDGDETTMMIDVPTTTDPGLERSLTMRRPGLYPITVQIVVDGDVAAQQLTFVERLPVEPALGQPLNVALLAAAPDPGPDPSLAELDDGRRRIEAIAAVGAAVDGPITVAIPPVLVADLDDDDPALLDSLRDALVGDELLARPADELDPSSAVAIGAGATFTRELRDGEDVLAIALPATPASRSGWIVASPLSAPAATMLRDLGFRTLALDAETYSESEGNIGGFVDTSLTVNVDLGDGGVLPALVVSPSGVRLDPERPDREGHGPVEEAVRIMAELLTARRELGPEQRRSVLLATPDLGVPDATVAAAVAQFADVHPDVRLAPLSTLAGTTDAMRIDDEPVTLTLPEKAGLDLRVRSERINLTRVSAQSAGSMQPQGDDLKRWEDELDTLLSTARDDEQVDAALDRISAEAEAVRAAVVAPRPFGFTLTGRSSTVRLNVLNNADEARRVVVRARSPKLTFPDGDQLVELGAGGVTEVVIAVEARSNGTSSIEVDLLTPAYAQQVDGPVVLTAHVNALTGLGQVITGGAVLVLVSWWYGHFRRRRRQRVAQLAIVDDTMPLASTSVEAAESGLDPVGTRADQLVDP